MQKPIATRWNGGHIGDVTRPTSPQEGLRGSLPAHFEWSKNGQSTQWGGCALLDRDPTVTFARPRAAGPSPMNLVRGGAGQPSIALKEGQAPAQALHRAGEGRMPGTLRSLSARKQ